MRDAMTNASTADTITPITSHRHFIMDDFKLSPGWFVLNENKMSGPMPRQSPQLMSLYKDLDSLSRKGYYAAIKHCISSPFGYWVSDTGRAALDEEISELETAANEKNEEASALAMVSGVEEFKALINFVFLRSDPSDPVLQRRIPSFLVERLSAVKEKLLTLDPKIDKKALVYTQDQTKRLHTMVASGRIASAIQHAGESAREIAHAIKMDPGEQASIDFSRIDEALGLLRMAEERLGG
jgi:hypothetical protein